MLEQYIPNQYLRAFVILIGLIILVRTGLFLLERLFLKIAGKTKTDIDDKLIEKASTPLTLIAFLISLRV